MQDPPAPKVPWVDLPTFKTMLRQEAELRMRILGGDWAGDIQKESNWRLRLYKEWLWSLSDDSGRALVEKRGVATTDRSGHRSRGKRGAKSRPDAAKKVLDPRVGPQSFRRQAKTRSNMPQAK